MLALSSLGTFCIHIHAIVPALPFQVRQFNGFSARKIERSTFFAVSSTGALLDYFIHSLFHADSVACSFTLLSSRLWIFLHLLQQCWYLQLSFELQFSAACFDVSLSPKSGSEYLYLVYMYKREENMLLLTYHSSPLSKHLTLACASSSLDNFTLLKILTHLLKSRRAIFYKYIVLFVRFASPIYEYLYLFLLPNYSWRKDVLTSKVWVKPVHICYLLQRSRPCHQLLGTTNNEGS